MKKCPFCAEEIQETAVKCKHCGEFLIDAELKKLKSTSGVEWYYKTPMVILWVLLLGPFALSFILKNPQYSNAQKTTWTIVTFVYTALITLILIGVIIFYFWIIGRIATHGL
ncbi:MAG: zinc ribbon domain-containing protein [Sedimentisphaerales bacterium]|nr:zinc ribbon domain-containing protein [Sedimentisphaerales bacterium]